MSDYEQLYPDIFEEIARLRRTGGCAVLITVVSASGSTPRLPGAKMLVYPDGRISGTVGGGIRESDIITEAKKIFDNPSARMMEVDFTEGITGDKGPVCGGVMTVFLERIDCRKKIIISGAGHIGYFLHRMLRMLDYNTVIIDPRAEFNNEQRFPGAELILREFVEGLGDLDPGEKDGVVIVGPGHDQDILMLPSVLRSSAGYIGMIGSKRKIKEVFEQMKQAGFTDKDLQRVHSPVGLDIGSESPAEIAVSIVAEIVDHFSTRKRRK